VGYEEARRCAREALRLGTAEEVHAWVEDRFKDVWQVTTRGGR
jgi:predicted 3-demethylubiquinone-9 3-methyltransferase (glyoxalase superfamily)